VPSLGRGDTDRNSAEKGFIADRFQRKASAISVAVARL